MFGGLTPQQFLAKHWQKRLGFFPGAFADFVSPVTPDELSGLACDSDVESRLVTGTQSSRVALEHGPVTEEQFRRLPEQGWTLLVQDVDKLVPNMAGLLAHFRFLPDWRIDDVMVSYAAVGGSVGPHTDDYDVFLLQAQGRRRWQLGEHFNPTLRDDCDLRVLKEFSPEREIIAEPGDLLYLPPNVAHHGVALEPALTLSIGFRAPEQRELVLAFVEELADRARRDRRFTDADRLTTSAPATVATSDLDQLRRLLREGIEASDTQLDDFLGRYLTQPKPHRQLGEGQESALAPTQIAEQLASGKSLVRGLGSRWLAREHESLPRWFIDGYAVPSMADDTGWLMELASGRPLGGGSLGRDTQRAALLQRLLEQGSVRWAEDD
jgi:50S ribosomal protein L16 3-hydroxylase